MPDIEKIEALQHPPVESHAENNRYRVLCDAAPVGFMAVGFNDIILDANLPASTLLGCSESHLPGLLFHQLVSKDHRHAYEQFRQLLIDTGTRQSTVIRMLNNGTVPFWAHLEATLANIPGDKNSPVLLVVLSDVTGRQEKDEALRESEITLRESQSIAGLGSYVLQFSDGLWSCSDFMNELFGIDESYDHSVEGWLSLIHPDDREMMNQYLSNEIIYHGRSFDKEYRIIRDNDHAVRWVHGLGRLEYDKNGCLMKMRGTVQDITTRVQIGNIQMFLAKACIHPDKEPFFTALARQLAESLNQDSVRIDRLSEDETTAHSLAIWNNGRPAPQGCYDLENSPGTDVLDGITYCVPANVRRIYPSDPWLREIHAESFVGVTLFGHTGRPIGLISVCSRSSITDRALIESALKLAAARAAGELERSDADLALQTSRKMIEGIISAVPVRIFWKDRNLTYLGCNKIFARDAGFSDASEIIGKNDYQLVWQEQAEMYRSADQQVVNSGIPVLDFEETQTTPDGRTIHVLTSKIPLHDPAGEICGVLGIYMDVTARHQAEKSRVLLTTAVEQADETIVITDTRGTIVYANPAFEKITGYPREEAIGRNPRILNSGKQDSRFYKKLWSTLQRGEVWNGHFVNKRKDGTLFEEDATISPVRDSNGKIVNYVAVKRDVTREVQLESQFRQSQKMEAFGQLAGGVAHDFNNILGAMMLQAEVTSMAPGISRETLEGLDQIRASATRAANLTRQLLLFSHKQVMQTRDLDLNEIVASLGKMLNRIIGEDYSLVIRPCPQPLRLHADGGMLDQLLMNLVINARDSMPLGGPILIRTDEIFLTPEDAAQIPNAQAGLHARLIVEDVGCGIEAEFLPRIFEPFFTTKEMGKGTGLGLATVFGIVERHNASIKVESEIGKGTVFTVHFPCSQNISAPIGQADEPDLLPCGDETILLVEDEPSLRRLTAATLESCGYSVIQAADGVEALELWKSHSSQVNLLLTDMIMPRGINGSMLANALVRADPQLRVIFTSGYNAEISGRELTLVAGQSFIQKPATPALLLQTVRQCLDTAV